MIGGGLTEAETLRNLSEIQRFTKINYLIQ